MGDSEGVDHTNRARYTEVLVNTITVTVIACTPVYTSPSLRGRDFDSETPTVPGPTEWDRDCGRRRWVGGVRPTTSPRPTDTTRRTGGGSTTKSTRSTGSGARRTTESCPRSSGTGGTPRTPRGSSRPFWGGSPDSSTLRPSVSTVLTLSSVPSHRVGQGFRCVNPPPPVPPRIGGRWESLLSGSHRTETRPVLSTSGCLDPGPEVSVVVSGSKLGMTGSFSYRSGPPPMSPSRLLNLNCFLNVPSHLPIFRPKISVGPYPNFGGATGSGFEIEKWTLHPQSWTKCHDPP